MTRHGIGTAISLTLWAFHHFFGLVLMGVIYALLVPVLIRWIDSGALITVVSVLLFVPVFIVSFWLADVLTGLLPPGTGDAEDSARPDDDLIIKTLEETGGKEAAESLREIFKHASDPVVRKAARKALEKMKE